MLAQVRGVIRTQGDLAPALTLPTGQAVSLARGETLYFIVQLLWSDGVPWAPAAGTAAVRVYDYVGTGGPSRPRWTKALTRRTDGLWEGTFTATDTARFIPGVQLYYSIWTADGADAQQAVATSLLTVTPG